MEPHKNNVLLNHVPNLKDGPKKYFEIARRFAFENYEREINRISSVRFDDVDPYIFFKEYIWVVHATGFSAKAVGKFFGPLTSAYGRYEELSLENYEDVYKRVRKVCNNPAKIKAVHSTSILMKKNIEESGWEDFKRSKLSIPGKLTNLSYIGKITCFHLARNIGILDAVKPDLHLIRMAKYWGYEDCLSMCKDLKPSDLELGIVDLILWYAASTFGTLEIKRKGER